MPLLRRQILSSTAAEVLALVAVRLKSTRLRRKALLDLGGQPLIVQLTRRIQRARRPQKIIWCTSTHPEDDELVKLAKQHNIACFRGAELDVMSRFITVAEEYQAHTVVRVTGDNPLTDPVMMDRMIESHLAANAEYSFNDELPRGTRSEIMNVAALRRCHDLAQDPGASEYMTLMIKRPDHFKVHRVTALGAEWIRPELRLTIDTAEDYAIIKAVFDHFGGEPPSLPQVIAFLDSQPQLRDVNQHVQVKEIDGSINVRLKGD